MKEKVDLPLLVIGGLLAATLIAFFTGALPYPFGWLVLSLFFIARVLQLRRRAAGKRR